MPDTIREVMIDRIRDIIIEYFDEASDDLVTDLADEAFSVCGISEKEQGEEW